MTTLHLMIGALDLVCAHAQVFRKNCVNSSANDQQKGRPQAPFPKFCQCRIRGILAKQLAL
jgi:hypothetical protein